MPPAGAVWTSQLGVSAPVPSSIAIFGMPHYGRVFTIEGSDGSYTYPQISGQWVDPQQTTWRVPVMSGYRYIIVRRPDGYFANFDVDVSESGANVINMANARWHKPDARLENAIVRPVTSPGSTGTAVFNGNPNQFAFAPSGAPGGKSMVLQGPNARRPTYDVATPTSQTIGERVVQNVNASPSSVAPGTAAVGAPSTAQCIAALRAIASRDPRAIVAAFHQSGLDGIVPSRPGSGNTAADVLALIDDCAARRQQYPRQFDSFCRIAQALSPSKPGGAPVRPAGGNPPGTDMTFDPADPNSAYQNCVEMGGVECERLRAPAAQQPGSSGPSAAQILGGVSSIATTGIGVLNSYLDRESAQHIEALRQNASSANAQIAANAQIEIARIQADAQARIAALGPNPSQQSVANALNTATQPPAQGMSTGTVAAIGVGAVAVAGIAYLALKKKG